MIKFTEQEQKELLVGIIIVGVDTGLDAMIDFIKWLFSQRELPKMNWGIGNNPSGEFYQIIGMNAMEHTGLIIALYVIYLMRKHRSKK